MGRSRAQRGTVEDRRARLHLQPVAGRAAARPHLGVAREVQPPRQRVGQLLERQPWPRLLQRHRPAAHAPVPRSLRARVRNSFPGRVPHLSVGMETAISRDGKTNEPAWSIHRNSLRLPVTARSLYLRAGGLMTSGEPKPGEGSNSYAYPRPAPDVTEPGPTEGGHSAGQLTWKGPVAPGGSVAYTTPPLKHDMVLAGPASLDLWLQSTATDTDLEATVTEVRPDGQETYVQRGWLRASHRKLDPARSTPLRPYQTHLRADAKPLDPGRPTYMRLEVFPFAHAFRKGSRLRVWIEAPTGHTGFWAFAPVGDPGTNTVLHNAAHPSRLVVGQVPAAVAHAPLPACDPLRNQPCRPDPLG